MSLSWNNRLKLAVTLVMFILVIAIVYMTVTRITVPWKVKEDRNSLRSVAAALEAYFVDWSEYPHELSLLTRVHDFVLEGDTLVERGTYLIEIPHSAFGKRLLPRYCRRNYHWFAWMPGPDRDFDIAVNNDFVQAYDMFWKNKDWQGESISSSWLIERLYDPTNGIRSSGDLLRSQFQ